MRLASGSGLGSLGGALSLLTGLGVSACGPMPGYVDPNRQVTTAPAKPAGPPAPPAPAPSVAATEDGDGDETDDAQNDVELDEPDGRNAPAIERNTGRQDRWTPSGRYVPPPRHDRPRAPATDEPASPTERYVPPPRVTETAPAPVEKPSGMRRIALDEDTYYLLDPVRKLCFLRHKETMTALDCGRIPEARDFAPGAPAVPVAPAAPDEEEAIEPVIPPSRPSRTARVDEPAPEPPRAGRGPSPDEISRFERAFVDIFCDRKGGEDVDPEQRISESGLKVARYEELESWWAADEKAWWSLTDKARRACPKR